MSQLLPCPESAMEVHRSTFSTLATTTGTLYFLRLPNNVHSPDQSSVSTVSVLQLLLKFSHRQLYKWEKCGG